MERASKHCMRARISICHDRIRFLKETLDESKQQLSSLVTEDISVTLLQFLKMRSQSVRNNIKARHENKLTNLRMEAENDRPSAINKKNWVINLSQKPLTEAERSLLEKGLQSYFETYAYDRRGNLLAMKQAIAYTNNLCQSQHLGVVTGIPVLAQS